MREKLIDYWDTANKHYKDPYIRLKQILTDLYDAEEEQVWLNNGAYLLLQVSKSSDYFTGVIFEEPLTNCKFDPLYINQFSNNINRS